LGSILNGNIIELYKSRWQGTSNCKILFFKWLIEADVAVSADSKELKIKSAR
jgi:hypothetical protein